MSYPAEALDANPELVLRLSSDLKESLKQLSPNEARYLVDYYYQLQRDRIRSNLQVRDTQENERVEVLEWLGDNTRKLEARIKNALGIYAAAQPVGAWSMGVVGVGPVIAAGLLAHIDIEKAPTVGHIYSFAGLVIGKGKLVKGQKRNWNAELKTLCYKLGESFVKFQNLDGCVYGKLFREKKDQLVAANERGDFAELVETEKLRYGKTTDAYAACAKGQLPQAHIHARARRWVVKMFLSHWHAVAYRYRFGVNPPKPYAIDHLGHAHVIGPENWPFCEDLWR